MYHRRKQIPSRPKIIFLEFIIGLPVIGERNFVAEVNLKFEQWHGT
jgi:hypothetical protein